MIILRIEKAEYYRTEECAATMCVLTKVTQISQTPWFEIALTRPDLQTTSFLETFLKAWYRGVSCSFKASLRKEMPALFSH